MTERRQVFRRDPIEIELGGDEVISVGPVPWQKRNDFGDAIVRQHIMMINEAVELYVDPDTSTPQLSAKLGEKFRDADELFQLCLSEEEYAKLKQLTLYHNQVIEILRAACEVNDLDQLIQLIDPKLMAPTTLGGIVSDLMLGQDLTPKTESSPDSSSEVSTAEPLNGSPTPSSVPS